MAADTIKNHIESTLDTLAPVGDYDWELETYIRPPSASTQPITYSITEYLAFHLEYTDYKIPGLILRQEGQLDFTPQAARAIAGIIEDSLSGDTKWEINIQTTDCGAIAEAPCFTIEATPTLKEGYETTVKHATELGWDFYAAVRNLTDPGTFGSAYLFDELARRFEENI